MAGRNLSRNRRRTIISGVSVGVAALVSCFMFAIKEGLLDNIQNNIINHITGNITVRNKLFTVNERYTPLRFFIPHVEQMIDGIKNIPGVADVSPASNFPVFIYRDNANVAAQVYGVDFSSSRIINDRETVLLEGGLPNRESREVLMSEGLANKLKFSSGDKFTIFTKTATGGSNGVTWTISGIARIGNGDLNAGSFLADWQEAARFLRMTTEDEAAGALSLLVFTAANANPSALIPSIQNYCDASGFEGDVRKWQDVSALSQFIQQANIIYTAICVIFFILSGTVIYNTAMTSVMERRKEIAALAALGMEGKNITLLFLIESLLIAALACIAGIAIGFGFVSVLRAHGLDMNALTGGSMSGMSLSSFIYPYMRPESYLLIFIMGVAISGLASIKPARTPLSVEPAQALRSEN
jgi:putative ABC transport system permease protein